MRIIPLHRRRLVDSANRCCMRQAFARDPDVRPRGRTINVRSRSERMAPNNPPDTSPDELSDEPIPAMQLLLDNPFLLLFIGIAMPTVLYIIWGVMEIVGIPVAK